MSVLSRRGVRCGLALLTAGMVGSAGGVGSAALAAAPLPAAGVGAPAPASLCPPTGIAPVRTAPGTGRTVALTFDDGASVYTPRILAVLRAARVRATFFDTGAHDAANSGYARRVLAAGQLLANHSWSHPNLATLPVSAQGAELDRTSTIQRQLTGVTPCFFRPPYGSYNSATLTAAHARRLAVVMWSVDTGDWRQSPRLSGYWTAAIIRQAGYGLRQSHPIVLMHSGKASHEPERQVAAERENTIAALPRIIAMYRAAGYRPVDLTGRS